MRISKENLVAATWTALCSEVAKLKLDLREGALVPITNSGASR